MPEKHTDSADYNLSVFVEHGSFLHQEVKNVSFLQILLNELHEQDQIIRKDTFQPKLSHTNTVKGRRSFDQVCACVDGSPSFLIVKPMFHIHTDLQRRAKHLWVFLKSKIRTV